MTVQPLRKSGLLFGLSFFSLAAIGGVSFRQSLIYGTSATDQDLYGASLAIFWASLFAIAALVAALATTRQSLRREEAAIFERHKFAMLVESSSDFIALTDNHRKLRYINQAGRKLIGMEPDEPVDGYNGPQFYPPEYNERMQREVHPGVLKSGSWHGEFMYRNFKTGEHIPIDMNVFPLRDPATGENMGMGAVSRDLRDRKRLEKEIALFFDVSLDILAIATTAGYFIRVNPAMCKVLGYTAEELCSRPVTDFIHPEDIRSTVHQLEVQHHGGSVHAFENRFRTKDGEYRWFSWNSYPIDDLTYGAARDITDEKNRQAHIATLSQQAIAASKAKSEFLANMSHEIRTPINGVIGMTSLLLDAGLTPQQLEYAEHVMTSAKSLLTVINDILDFSKIEAGKLDIETIDFDLDELIDDTVRTMAWSVRNKSLPLIVKMEKPAPHMYRGDPGRIRQILTNLLSNAIKFTESGEIVLEVVRLRDTGTATQFQFVVKDTGIGISPEVQKYIFNAFAQAEASTNRRFGGTGLGLSISRRLVEIMGGKISVSSVEGQGSTFRIHLTLAHAPESARKNGNTLPQLATRFPGAKILVAEDNFINQKIVMAMLTKMGFSAQTVANGEEVLSLLRERQFDLVLMDCQMPVMDGYEATRKIRESRTITSTIPIIAMTANALKGDREKCLEAGMNDYAAKPVNMVDLFDIIEKWLKHSAAAENSPNLPGTSG